MRRSWIAAVLLMVAALLGSGAAEARGHHGGRQHGFGHHHQRGWSHHRGFHHRGFRHHRSFRSRGFHHRGAWHHHGIRHFHYGWHRVGGRGVAETAAVAGGGALGGGMASWYGGRGAGLTAAHRSLPFGSRVLVTNRANGRSVVVRITDRGPFIRGRVIDLNRASARAIGVTGVSPVALRRL